MVSAGIDPNVNTYSALIDGCARAGQVAKAFGAYGIMSSKVMLFCLMCFVLDVLLFTLAINVTEDILLSITLYMVFNFSYLSNLLGHTCSRR